MSVVSPLAGADAVLVPTALPAGPSGTFIANHMIQVRAFENQIFVAYINHAGADERFTFAGLSRIAAPDGSLIAACDDDAEQLIFAEIDPGAFAASHQRQSLSERSGFSMTETIETDVLVIGAGIAGVGVAAALADTHRVVIIERETQPGYHSTGRSAAIFLPNYGNDVIRGLNHASAPMFEQRDISLFPEPLLTARGSLTVADEAALRLAKNLSAIVLA